MSDNWKAEVMRLNPATDVLVVKVPQRLSAEHAHQIKQAIARELPLLRTLILGGGIEVAVIRKTRRRTIVAAKRGRRTIVAAKRGRR